MLRAVVDPGVVISSLISAGGAPAHIIRRWLAGDVQFICSPALLDEFESVCSRPRFRQWFSQREALGVSDLLRDAAEMRPDIPADVEGPVDAGDRYLIELAISAKADCLVTGDEGLLRYSYPRLRIVRPRQLLNALDALDRL